MSTKKVKPDAATQREESRKSLQAMLANPTPMNNISAVGADKPEPASQAEVKSEAVEPAPVAVQPEAKQAAEVVQPKPAAEPAPVAQAAEPVPTQPQSVQESAPVSEAPQNPMAAMAAMVTGMIETGGLNPEFLKECNVSTPLDPRRAQLLKLAGMFSKKSQKAIMTEALDMWLKSHGLVPPN